MTAESFLERLGGRLNAHGLLLRGGFHPAAGDDVPALADGRAPGTVILIGNAGAAMWGHFSASAESRLAHSPLDRWTRRVVEALAREVAATAVFPFGEPPHLPFQRWALRADDVHVSPIKLLIHPVYGLWHAYRGALVFDERLALPPRACRASPCDRCHARPCLASCPVDAFANARYDDMRCADHVESPAGDDCRALGCRARRSCPVGGDHAYAAAQARFHMRAFLSRRGAAAAPLIRRRTSPGRGGED